MYMKQLANRALGRTEYQEQHHKEWDYIDINPDSQPADAQPRVAGKYGPWSNIFHIGLVSKHSKSRFPSLS